MILQDALRAGKSRTYLATMYAILSKEHPKYPNLIQFRYSQIESPMGDSMVQEARGVILDSANNWSVVCRPFGKFFNAGEGHAAKIDWVSAKVQEKLDGSLCTLYYYDNSWHVATTGTPDASGEVNGAGISFADLFWRNFKKLYWWPDTPDICYMFELMGPLNRVVVQHQEERLILLGARNTNGTEYEPELWNKYLPVVKSFGLTSLAEIEASFLNMEPLKQEGYVVVDKYFNRIKVKHPGYVALHHMMDRMSPRRVLEVVRSGEISEVLTAFPEWKQMLEEMQDKYAGLIGELESAYSLISGIKNQKEFALEAVKTKCSAALFQLRAKRVASIREYLAKMQIDSLAGLLNVGTADEIS